MFNRGVFLREFGVKYETAVPVQKSMRSSWVYFLEYSGNGGWNLRNMHTDTADARTSMALVKNL